MKQYTLQQENSCRGKDITHPQFEMEHFRVLKQSRIYFEAYNIDFYCHLILHLSVQSDSQCQVNNDYALLTLRKVEVKLNIALNHFVGPQDVISSHYMYVNLCDRYLIFKDHQSSINVSNV